MVELKNLIKELLGLILNLHKLVMKRNVGMQVIMGVVKVEVEVVVVVVEEEEEEGVDTTGEGDRFLGVTNIKLFLHSV